MIMGKTARKRISMNMNYRKNRLRLHTIKRLVIRHTEKVKQGIQNTADDAVNDTDHESYAADTLETHFKDTGISATEVARQSAVRSYSRYKTIKDKRLKSQIRSVPHAAEINSSTNAVQEQKQQLKKAVFKREALRSHMKKSVTTDVSISKSVAVRSHPSIHSRNKMIDGAVAAGKRITAKVLHAAISVLSGVSPAIAVVVVVTIFAGTISAVVGSPFGILFAGQSGDPNEIAIPSIVQETNLAFSKAISEEIQAHPECTEVEVNYSYAPGSSWKSDWPEVLAIFAVTNNLQNEEDVIIIDEKKKQKIQDVFWQMHQIDSVVETIELEVPLEAKAPSILQIAVSAEQEAENESEIITVQKLVVTVSSKTVTALSEEMHFTQEQNEILSELLSSGMRPYLVALVGSSENDMLWPLPGYTQISTYFGAPDAFGKPGHKGIDIPAPEGTPILAAHSGTVVIANTHDSYGNQVLLDSADGISTRYAHMIRYSVTSGQSVSAGEVIGYVGSTGMSTGNHLHFEVRINGELVDPLGCFN